MKLSYLSLGVLTVAVGLNTMIAADQSADKTTFRFPVGFNFASGAYKVNDNLKEALVIKYAGKVVLKDNSVFPVGLSANPYVDFGNGFGAGLSLGPTIFAATSGDERSFSYIIPVGADVRYMILRDKKVSPYLRAGVRYSVAGGDYFSAGSPGVYGGVGVEVLRTKKISFGVEAGYDSSTIKVKYVNQKVTPIGFTIGIAAVF